VIELNRQERYLLVNAFHRQVRELDKSGNYSERSLHRKFYEKVADWVYEGEGNITSSEGVRE